ncbi:hypothetical protein AHF37_07246, partial [Paragonimus kellicotti]
NTAWLGSETIGCICLQSDLEPGCHVFFFVVFLIRLPNSHVEYDIATVQADLNGSLVNPSPTIDRHIMITSGGLIHTLSAPDGHSVRRQATVRIRSFPKIHSSDTTRQSGAQSFADQVLLLQVEIKPPRYIQAIPASGDHLKSTTGLHVGGPYHMSVTYHDEFGRTFDAVAEKYLRLKTRLHRTDLVDVQLLPSALAPTSSRRSSTHEVEADDLSRTTLSLRVLSVLPDQSTRHVSALEPITTVLQLSGTDKAIGFWPVYLSVPYGGELNIGIPSALIASQWMCFAGHDRADCCSPARILFYVVGGSVWSSTNPSVLWVDANSRLLLARRAGKAYLVYRRGSESDQNLPDNMSNSTEGPMRHPSYLIRLTVSSLSAFETALRLVRLHSEDEPSSPEQAVLPLLNHPFSPAMDSATSVRFLVQHTNRPEPLPDNDRYLDSVACSSDRSLLFECQLHTALFAVYKKLGLLAHYFWVNNPTELTRRMLLFVPPTTAAVLSSNRAGRPVVRSKSPHILDATNAPRPVASLSEVAQVVTQYVHSLSSAPTTLWGTQPGLPLTMWTAIALEQVHQMENEAAVSQTDSEQTVKQGLLWVVELKANVVASPVHVVARVLETSVAASFDELRGSV